MGTGFGGGWGLALLSSFMAGLGEFHEAQGIEFHPQLTAVGHKFAKEFGGCSVGDGDVASQEGPIRIADELRSLPRGSRDTQGGPAGSKSRPRNNARHPASGLEPVTTSVERAAVPPGGAGCRAGDDVQ